AHAAVRDADARGAEALDQRERDEAAGDDDVGALRFEPGEPAALVEGARREVADDAIEIGALHHVAVHARAVVALHAHRDGGAGRHRPGDADELARRAGPAPRARGLA